MWAVVVSRENVYIQAELRDAIIDAIKKHVDGDLRKAVDIWYDVDTVLIKKGVHGSNGGMYPIW